MISNIKIKNYRSIKELELKDFQQFNLFVGANNVGKSSILEALSISSVPFDLHFPVRTNNLRSYHAIQTDQFYESYFFDFDTKNQVQIELELSNPHQKRNIFISAMKNNMVNIETPIPMGSKLIPTEIDNEISSINVDTSILKKEHQYSASINFTLRQELNWEAFQKDPENTKFQRVGYYATFIPKEGFPPQDAQEKLSLDSTPCTYISPRIYEDIREEVKRFDKLVTSKRKKHLIKALKHLDQNLVDITYSSDYSFWCDTGLEKLVPMPVMGDGFILSFKILLAIANSEGGAIFIDEVENGIYYGYLKQYWNTILQTAKEFDVQVFATTHSAECVKSFINCKINQEQQDDSRLYRIEKYKEKLQAVIYTEKDLKLTINNGWELR